MTLPLRNLDDVTYADLVADALARIPGLCPEWTNHNPSDPGITLVELFAWLTELLIYRANRITDQQRRAFLRLLRGPDAPLGTDLASEIRDTVNSLRDERPAISCEDYEKIIKQIADDNYEKTKEKNAKISRVKCIPEHNLEAGTESERENMQPGHISTILVPARGVIAPSPKREICRAVKDDFEPKRLLTVRHHVTGPVYVPVSAEVLIQSRPEISDAELGPSKVVRALRKYLHPLWGGANQQGWPFGRPVYIWELTKQLRSLPGVVDVPDMWLTSECKPEDVRHEQAKPLWGRNDDFAGLELKEYHLPHARIVRKSVFIGHAFAPLGVEVKVTVSKDANTAEIKRGIKKRVRDYFHPLLGGPNGQQSWAIVGPQDAYRRAEGRIIKWSDIENQIKKINHDIIAVQIESIKRIDKAADDVCISGLTGELVYTKTVDVKVQTDQP